MVAAIGIYYYFNEISGRPVTTVLFGMVAGAIGLIQWSVLSGSVGELVDWSKRGYQHHPWIPFMGISTIPIMCMAARLLVTLWVIANLYLDLSLIRRT